MDDVVLSVYFALESAGFPTCRRRVNALSRPRGAGMGSEPSRPVTLRENTCGGMLPARRIHPQLLSSGRARRFAGSCLPAAVLTTGFQGKTSACWQPSKHCVMLSELSSEQSTEPGVGRNTAVNPPALLFLLLIRPSSLCV